MAPHNPRAIYDLRDDMEDIVMDFLKNALHHWSIDEMLTDVDNTLNKMEVEFRTAIAKDLNYEAAPGELEETIFFKVLGSTIRSTSSTCAIIPRSWMRTYTDEKNRVRGCQPHHRPQGHGRGGCHRRHRVGDLGDDQ